MATIDHEQFVQIYDRFVTQTEAGHREAQMRRDYVNNIQHSADEVATLNKRKQPIITDNRIKRKTDYFLGVERQTRTDPKAFPRTPEHEDAANAFTDGIRFVCDNNDWDIERSEGFDALIVEGIEGYSITKEDTPAGIEIRINHIPWDRIIYDVHSRDRFFRDSSRKGIVLWMDEQDAKDLFPGKEDIIDGSYSTEDSTVFDDRPNFWTDKDRARVKVIQLYYLKQGVWFHCIYCKGGFLVEPEESFYKDEYGRPDCPIELAGAYVDRDNDRFGLVQDMMSLQDMVNKATSKYMHIINSNQTWGNQHGPDANKAKIEAAKPDGHFELTGDSKFGEDFGVIPTDSKAIGTYNILQTALQSLQEIGGNQLVDESASGRSKEVTQQTKLIELGPVLDTHRQCSKRVYRHVFNRMRQFWTEEKWVRVTDDERNLKFVMINQPFTFRDALEEKFGQVPPEAANHPMLDEVMEIRNNVQEIDVDIIVEEAPDIINIQQEQFTILAGLAKVYGPEEVPFQQMLELSTLRNKDKFIEDTKGSEEERAAQAQMMQQKQQEAEEIQKAAAIAEIQNKNAETNNKQADAKAKEARAMKDLADAEAQRIENHVVQLELGILNG